MKLKYFKESEFNCKCGCGGGFKEMDEALLKKLDEARDRARVPFKINSAYRCKKHNTKVGGVKESPHMGGFAVDISASSSMMRYRVMKALIEVGFTRIGVYKTFIHADTDYRKAEGVMWYV